MPMDSRSVSELQDTPVLPEVIVNGRKVAPGSDEVIKETLDLVNMANLAKIRKRLDDQASIGLVMSYDRTVTSKGEDVILDTPCQSLSLINDGPAVIRLGINRREPVETLNVGQAFNVNFGNHALRWFYVVCDDGLTANIRAVTRA